MMASGAAVMTPLATGIEALVEGVPGFSPVDELFALATLVHATAGLPGDIVEIGSWCGRSTVVLAQAAADAGGARVHAVDLFPDRADWHPNADGTFSFRTLVDGVPFDGYAQQTVWPEAFDGILRPLYETCGNTFEIFSRVLAERGLGPAVSVHRGTSETFSRGVPDGFRCRLAFIDGDHGYEAVRRDIRALAPLLVPGGWLCFDDAHSGYEGVDRAIAEEVLASPAFTNGRQLTRKLFVAQKSGGRRPA
ncbi:MAG: class I SAM-dependent methyltransferase [Vicinamibacterales bacterium]